MIRLNEQQLEGKKQFIKDYIESNNAADASKVDANANVSSKNIATMDAEIHKDFNIQINRSMLYDRINELYDKETADEYIRQLEAHEIYTHDETSLKPYCMSISMYPFLLDGITKLGGDSDAPKHLQQFCGGFVNLVFAAAAQIAGAIATVEFLLYFDYFARKDYGLNYLEENKDLIDVCLGQVVYSINQPAAARGYQSVFWNISVYDEHYYNSLFGDFVFPDGTRPKWETLNKLQNYFMKWFNKERTKKELTFPVVTAAMLSDGMKPKDGEFAGMLAQELSDGNSFFMYISESADSLASCCRLRNEMTDNTFSYSLGAGGVSTGSVNVITVNMNRLIQQDRDLKTEIDKIHKYQIAYRSIIKDYIDAGMISVYDAGFISLDKQFLTIGLNGMTEAAEYKGLTVGNNDEYKLFLQENLEVFYNANKEIKEKTGIMFNTEFVPAENLGVKNANWDRKDGLEVPRDCYNSYFYNVEDNDVNIMDKLILHGKQIITYLDGGSALHLNLEESLTKDSYLHLINSACKTGTNYFTINVKSTICNKCGHIDKKTLFKCSKCGSYDVDYLTRIIGYLKRISSFSTARQKEAKRRFYH